ncbi:uncharacterized protein PAE49_004619 [Odontesthes bonariensis]|uniref:uncharacterized protein LOC142379378 n=1 Tax=Odontesthes bonariensis TaxID=219752 RepID=UPI003F58D69B
MSTTEVDVEALQKSDRRRRSCLDAFLVMSVIFLFMAVSALTAGGVMVLKKIQLEQKPKSLEFDMGSLRGNTPSPAFKMQNFAYLQATKSKLDNYTMTWTPTAYGEGTSLGSNFDWNSEQNSLKPHKEGIYFVYINVSLTCTSTCRAGLLRLTMGDKLTCEVELTSHKTSESKKCWTVKPLHGKRLNIQMTVLKEKLENWKLDLPNSGFGIFLVD